ncbi:hypothetical protein [Nocardia sp. XZ_19_231]|uniref:relaxase/mobilization nuclease domain-containing protein n=1 Tax=Nocardia sp. XZ_19_231 TaxID=2769252 RepID=UPI00188ED444|nr:hypothetical protein [Nocardia sp. XZ_19_231]
MIPKIKRGQKLGGLVVYLLGEGRANEHRHRHVIAGSATVMRPEWLASFDGPADKRASRDAALAIANEIEIPRKLHGTTVKMRAKPAQGQRGQGTDVIERPDKGAKGVLRDAPVWHCILSLNPGEELTDEQWSNLINDFMAEMGFVGDGDVAEARWVAIRHGHSGETGDGQDHVHIAASLVREDGSAVDTYFRDPKTGRPRGDFAMAQAVANRLEHRHGLQVLASREEGGALSGNSRAEVERAARTGSNSTEREVLRRTVRSCAVASKTEAEFVRRCQTSGVAVTARFGRGKVVGYSYQLEGDDGPIGPRLGGAKGLGGLGLPALREQWEDTPEERQAAVAALRGEGKPGRESLDLDNPKLWLQAARDLEKWNKELRQIPSDDRETYEWAAGRAAGVFSAWSARVEPDGGVLTDAADELTRSAQPRDSARRSSSARPESMPDLGWVAVTLTQLRRRTGGDPLYESMLLMRQLLLTLAALASAHEARAELGRALQLRDRAVEPLAAMHAHYAELYAQKPTTATRELEDEEQRAERLRAAGLDEDTIGQIVAAESGAARPGRVPRAGGQDYRVTGDPLAPQAQPEQRRDEFER